MKTIADRIKEALEIRNMKQADLVEKTGIGKSSISTYISGAYEPKQKNIYKISKALNVNEPWLMGLDVPMEKTLNLNSTNNAICLTETKLISIFSKFNEVGKVEAINRLEELSQINKYIQKDDNSHLIPFAAHSKEGATKEDFDNDMEIMNNDDEWK